MTTPRASSIPAVMLDRDFRPYSSRRLLFAAEVPLPSLATMLSQDTFYLRTPLRSAIAVARWTLQSNPTALYYWANCQRVAFPTHYTTHTRFLCVVHLNFRKSLTEIPRNGCGTMRAAAITWQSPISPDGRLAELACTGSP